MTASQIITASALASIGIYLAIETFADLRARYLTTLNDSGDEGADACAIEGGVVFHDGAAITLTEDRDNG